MKDWGPFVSAVTSDIQKKTAGRPVLAGLSGGIDSSVAVVLAHRAVGDRLTCIFVDHGLMRKGESEEVRDAFEQFGIRLIRVNAQDRFFRRLDKVEDPEKKRKIVGEEFIRVFEEEARKMDGVGFLVQGTIYTDVAESGEDGHKIVKSHHNVGGLPDVLAFEGIIEPLRTLYKQDVRMLGEFLGLPERLTRRQPFPGPGLAVRILGAVTAERVETLREADAIFREEMDEAGVPSDEYFAVHTGLCSTGVVNEARLFGHVIALRAVQTADLISAEWTRIPYDVLARASSRITTQCPHVCRVVYDITTKPPATIEWE